jgi:hypothetical protein
MSVPCGVRRPMHPPTVVAVDWWNEAEDVFSTSHQYVCQTRRSLTGLSSSFSQSGLGSFHGNLRITPAGRDAVIGFIEEVEPNRRTLRPLFHDNVPRMTTSDGQVKLHEARGNPGAPCPETVSLRPCR